MMRNLLPYIILYGGHVLHNISLNQKVKNCVCSVLYFTHHAIKIMWRVITGMEKKNNFGVNTDKALN